MNMILLRRIGYTLTLCLLLAGVRLRAQPAAGSPAPDITPQNVLNVMQRVADWQLANPSKHKTTDWTQAAGYDGFMALAGISGDPKYRDAMMAVAETNDWKLGQRKYMADDQGIGQLYTELYFLYRDPKMIAPMREKFDWIMANPSTVTNLVIRQPHGTDRWTWCDSLFMAPPAWVRLYVATDDERYLDYGVTNWWRTTDFLYDTNEHLFYRDCTYFNKREANGQKVFWGRGNGWVMGGLVRVLQYLPMNHPDRPRFEQLFKDMAARILVIQQPDGLWHASLLDPASYPYKETSGSGFFTYALAWGVNQGLLDRATYEPAVRKAWTALTACVNADGRLTYVQPIGADPKKFDPNSTEVYGVGAFLLAGSEVYKMTVLDISGDALGPWGGPPPIGWRAKIKVTNPSNFRRDCETIEIQMGEPNFDVLRTLDKWWAVMDGVSSHILDSQTYEGKLLFQVDLAPHESRTYYILDASVLAAVPPPIVKTFACYVPKRHDDIGWESDRIAHRMYGPALETWKAEPLTSSGIDVWIKRTRGLVVNHMYGTMKFFETNGVSQDDYKVGKTRGDGGLGIWQDGKLYVSKNWRTYKIITTGPIRSEFELTYDAWDAGGRKVSETKRISIDANSYFCKAQSTFTCDDSSPLTIAVGLAERPGSNVIDDDSPLPGSWPGEPPIHKSDFWKSSTDQGLIVQNQKDGWMSYWQPQDFNKGTTGVAIVVPGIETFTNDKPDLAASAFTPPTHTVTEGQPALRNLLAIAPAEVGKPFVYYFGACWDMSGDFTNAQQWTEEVRRYNKTRNEPLQVTVGN